MRTHEDPSHPELSAVQRRAVAACRAALHTSIKSRSQSLADATKRATMAGLSCSMSLTAARLSRASRLFANAQTARSLVGTQASRLYHSSSPALAERHGTTIVCVRKNGKVCMMGDGMVSMGSMIVKPNAVKLRRILSKASQPTPTLVGFAGSTADAFTLLERLEGKLDEYPGQLARSCVELAKGWRTDKYLRRLEASLLVADASISLEITGNGDVLESHNGILGVGSGSVYAVGE
jgi:ATP-dependent HslUV protease, peptidase subunit HslV